MTETHEIRRMTGIAGVLVTAGMAVGSSYVLLTATFVGNSGTAAVTVFLFLVGIISVPVVYSLIFKTTSLAY